MAVVDKAVEEARVLLGVPRCLWLEKAMEFIESAGEEAVSGDLPVRDYVWYVREVLERVRSDKWWDMAAASGECQGRIMDGEFEFEVMPYKGIR